jgi:hypothetical protein
MLTSNSYVLDEDPARLAALEPVPPAERGDREALWQRLRRDGYLYLSGHLDPELVVEFRRYYFAALAHTGLVAPGSDPVDGIARAGPLDRGAYREALFDSIVPSAEYEALCRNPLIAEWFA